MLERKVLLFYSVLWICVGLLLSSVGTSVSEWKSRQSCPALIERPWAITLANTLQPVLASLRSKAVASSVQLDEVSVSHVKPFFIASCDWLDQTNNNYMKPMLWFPVKLIDNGVQYACDQFMVLVDRIVAQESEPFIPPKLQDMVEYANNWLGKPNFNMFKNFMLKSVRKRSFEKSLANTLKWIDSNKFCTVYDNHFPAAMDGWMFLLSVTDAVFLVAFVYGLFAAVWYEKSVAAVLCVVIGAALNYQFGFQSLAFAIGLRLLAFLTFGLDSFWSPFASHPSKSDTEKQQQSATRFSVCRVFWILFQLYLLVLAACIYSYLGFWVIKNVVDHPGADNTMVKTAIEYMVKGSPGAALYPSQAWAKLRGRHHRTFLFHVVFSVFVSLWGLHAAAGLLDEEKQVSGKEAMSEEKRKQKPKRKTEPEEGEAKPDEAAEVTEIGEHQPEESSSISRKVHFEENGGETVEASTTGAENSETKGRKSPPGDTPSTKAQGKPDEKVGKKTSSNEPSGKVTKRSAARAKGAKGTTADEE